MPPPKDKLWKDSEKNSTRGRAHTSMVWHTCLDFKCIQLAQYITAYPQPNFLDMIVKTLGHIC